VAALMPTRGLEPRTRLSRASDVGGSVSTVCACNPVNTWIRSFGIESSMRYD